MFADLPFGYGQGLQKCAVGKEDAGILGSEGMPGLGGNGETKFGEAPSGHGEISRRQDTMIN